MSTLTAPQYATIRTASGRVAVQCTRPHCDYYGVGADQTVADALGKAHQRQHERRTR